MHLIIAGGAGFVGSQLAFWFRCHYPFWKITVLDNLSRKGSALNVPRLEAAGIRFRQADTRFPEQLAADEPVDMVIDAAAEPSVLAGLQDGLDYLIHTNFNGTVHLLNLARQQGAGFIFLSTSRIYPYTRLQALPMQEGASCFALPDGLGIPGLGPQGLSEDFPLVGARSLYGATKLSSELMVQEYAAAFGLQALVNRCGVLAGPWQMGKVDQGVTALWLARHFWQQPLQYIGFGGQGLQVRDLLHVHDLCRLVDYQLHHLSALSGRTFNVGGGPSNAVSLQELTGLCQSIIGHRVPIASVPDTRPGDIPWYVTDNTRITAATGWKPEKTVVDILQDTHHWIREHEAALKPVLG